MVLPEVGVRDATPNKLIGQQAIGEYRRMEYPRAKERPAWISV
jgi:hypothetical protein